MKRPRCRTNLTLAMILMSALTLVAAGKEFEKTITRDFNISATGTVEVINKYGGINVHTWQQGNVRIDVRITVDARNQDKAEETLDRISVDFSDSQARVKAETQISTVKSWKRWFGSNTDKFKIDYDVYLPATVELDLNNKYGDVFVPSMDNRISIDLKYGSIQVEDINGDASISLGYAKGSLASALDANLDLKYSTLRCGSLGDLRVDSKYGRLEVESARNVRAASSYDDYKIDQAESITNSGKYDDIIIGTVGRLNVNTKYSDVEVQELQKEADLNMKYGGAVLNSVKAGFSHITVETSYTGVRINTDSNARFTFEAETKYCKVRDSGIEMYFDQRKTGETSLKGYRGSRDATASISATMDYGSLTIN